METVMKFSSCFGLTVLVGAVSWLSLALPAGAAGQAAKPPEVASRDGQHDFDFNFGVWKTHIKRLLHPLSGSTESIELDGTVTVRKVWDGRANWRRSRSMARRVIGKALPCFSTTLNRISGARPSSTARPAPRPEV
jgi:hypothetical protein